MTLQLRERSLVALDPTPRGVAYVFFENSEYMDAGTRGAPEDADLLAVVNEILEGTAADVLVLESPDDPRCRRHARLRHVLRVIAKHARARGVPVLTVARHDVQEAWRKKGFTTKEAVAAEIARRVPDLEPFVPAKRKFPANEDPRVNLFDAASLALHLLDAEQCDSFVDELAL